MSCWCLPAWSGQGVDGADSGVELRGLSGMMLMESSLGKIHGYAHCHVIQVTPRGLPSIHLQLEPIPLESGDYVQMYVRHLLEGGPPVGQEEVVPFASHATSADGVPNVPRNSRLMSPDVTGQIHKAGVVLLRQHEHVTLVDGSDVHDGEHLFILVDLGRRNPAGHNRAEDAV